MDELGLLLDCKDFATNSYTVDEVQHPRTASKSGGRKDKALVRASKDKEEQEEYKENVVAGGTFMGADDDPLILSDDNDDYCIGGSKALLTGATLTSPIVNMEALLQRRNVIAPRSLFIDESVLKRAKHHICKLTSI